VSETEQEEGTTTELPGGDEPGEPEEDSGDPGHEEDEDDESS